MRIYLVQHGEAVDSGTDPDRPLSARGRNEVTRMARFLRDAGIAVDRIVHSGKTRARQTAEILSTELLNAGAPEAIAGINPKDAIDPFVAEVNVWSADTLVVGHLPFMAGAVSCLLLGRPDPDLVAYRPGSVVCLGKDDAGAWHIEWIIRPELTASDEH